MLVFFVFVIPLFWSAAGRHQAPAATIEVKNRCNVPVWPGTVGDQEQNPANGGFKLEAGKSKTLELPPNWNGTIWVRTNCDKYMNCDSGTCGNFLECAGREGEVPHTKAQFQLDEHGLDTYLVSLMDGYNVNLSIYPHSVTQSDKKDNCEMAGGCNVTNLQRFCPEPLQVILDDEVVACNTACNVFGNPSYCCSGVFDNPEACTADHWSIDYPAKFKQGCPRARSFKYDIKNVMYTCAHKTASRNYIVRIC